MKCSKLDAFFDTVYNHSVNKGDISVNLKTKNPKLATSLMPAVIKHVETIKYAYLMQANKYKTLRIAIIASTVSFIAYLAYKAYKE